MKSNYHAFVTRMINKYEGGYGWDKADPGGPTKYGITCYDLAANRGQKVVSMGDWVPIVKAMPLSEAEDIYAKKYARAVFFDQLNSGVDALFMDYAVNSGTGRAAKVARALVKQPDGTHFDAETVKRLNAMDPKQVIKYVQAERLGFMKRIRGGSAWQTFGKGWGARISDLTAYCLTLASGTTPAVAPVEPAEPKTGKAKVAVPDVSKTGTAVSTGAGAAGAGGWEFFGIDGTYVGIAVIVVVALTFVVLVLRKNKAEKEDRVVIPVANSATNAVGE